MDRKNKNQGTPYYLKCSPSGVTALQFKTRPKISFVCRAGEGLEDGKPALRRRLGWLGGAFPRPQSQRPEAQPGAKAGRASGTREPPAPHPPGRPPPSLTLQRPCRRDTQSGPSRVSSAPRAQLRWAGSSRPGSPSGGGRRPAPHLMVRGGGGGGCARAGGPSAPARPPAKPVRPRAARARLLKVNEGSGPRGPHTAAGWSGRGAAARAEG